MSSKKDAEWWRNYRANKTPVAKELEKEQVKPDRGKLVKGLGEIPGREVDPAMSEAWTRSRPAPKK